MLNFRQSEVTSVSRGFGLVFFHPFGVTFESDDTLINISLEDCKTGTYALH